MESLHTQRVLSTYRGSFKGSFEGFSKVSLYGGYTFPNHSGTSYCRNPTSRDVGRLVRGGPFLQGLAKRAVCTGAYKVGFRFLGRLGQAGRNEPYIPVL